MRTLTFVLVAGLAGLLGACDAGIARSTTLQPAGDGAAPAASPSDCCPLSGTKASVAAETSVAAEASPVAADPKCADMAARCAEMSPEECAQKMKDCADCTPEECAKCLEKCEEMGPECASKCEKSAEE